MTLSINTGLSSIDIDSSLSYRTGLSYFSPLDISNLSLWLDANDASTITSSGGAVSQWNDKSGLGNHVTQGTGANQPITGTRTINSKNVIDFDGTNDNFAMPSGLYSIPAGDNTLIAVTLIDSTAASGNILCMTDGGAARYRLLPVDTVNVTISATNNTSNLVNCAFGATLSTVNPRITYLLRSSTNVKVGTDGGVSANVAANNFTATIGTIGMFPTGAQPLNGVMAEILIYSKALTNAEMNLVCNYLKAKWGAAWINI